MKTKFNKILDNLSNIIIIFNVNSEIKYINEFGSIFFGFNFNEIQDKNIFNIFSANIINTECDFLTTLRKICNFKTHYASLKTKSNSKILDITGWENFSIKDDDQIIIDSRKTSFEVQLEDKNKENYWFDIHLSPIIEQNNIVKDFLLLIVNITKRKKLEKEKESLIKKLEANNEELKKLSKLKDEFLSIASHDLRSPFCGILGLSELLVMDKTLNEKHRNIIKRIQNSASLQLNYITDLLNSIQMDSLDFILDKKLVEIDNIIKDSVNMLNILAINKNVKIILDIKKTKEIEIDASKITQVMNNLLSNAIKFTKSNDKITIKTFENSFQEIEIHVIDTGIGISSDKTAGLFSKFNMAKSKGTAGEIGSGLGLSICKIFVELHGGKIGVNSSFNEGSDFYFTLPYTTENY